MDMPRILLLRGGPGAERDISLQSGTAVATALRAAGYSVTERDISPEDLTALDEPHELVFPVLHGEFGEDGTLQAILEQGRHHYVGSDAASSRLAIDKWASKVAFRNANLPTTQAVLVRLDQKTNRFLQSQPLLGDANGPNSQQPTATAETPSSSPSANSSRATPQANSPFSVHNILKTVGLPCILKPSTQGSSIGITVVRHAAILERVLKKTIRQYGDTIVEPFITGRELTVGILARTPLPVLEVLPAEGFYDFNAKYQADTTDYRFLEPTADQPHTGGPNSPPHDTNHTRSTSGTNQSDNSGTNQYGNSGTSAQAAPITAELIETIQQTALSAFETLGCRDFARVDGILTPAGCFQLLEINTIPGFTSHSLLPKAAEKIGLNFQKLCHEIAQIALKRPI